MNKRLPSLFVSHGLPPIALQDDPYNTALVNFGRFLGSDLKGVVCVSSQWVQPGPIQITALSKPFIQHNFHGYQKELYEISYSPPNSVDLIEQVAQKLEESDFDVGLTPDYGLDHGVWMPMRLIRPEADIPVLQISLPMLENPRMVMKMGHALSSLRNEGILLVGSGAAALNMQKVVWYARGEDVQPKILEFNDWLKKNLLTANVEEILNYRDIAPHAEFAHPSSANLLPLFFTMGTSLAGDKPQIIYEGFKYSSTSLFSFSLTDEAISEGLLS